MVRAHDIVGLYLKTMQPCVALPKLKRRDTGVFAWGEALLEQLGEMMPRGRTSTCKLRYHFLPALGAFLPAKEIGPRHYRCLVFYTDFRDDDKQEANQARYAASHRQVASCAFENDTKAWWR